MIAVLDHKTKLDNLDTGHPEVLSQKHNQQYDLRSGVGTFICHPLPPNPQCPGDDRLNQNAVGHVSDEVKICDNEYLNISWWHVKI